MISIQECIKEWTELGYTNEQSKELDRLSRLGAESNNIIDANSASESLINTMKQFELDLNDKNSEIIEKIKKLIVLKKQKIKKQRFCS